MRRLALFCFLIASLPGLATADAPLRRLLTADDAKAWQGVGRLNVQIAFIFWPVGAKARWLPIARRGGW